MSKFSIACFALTFAALILQSSDAFPVEADAPGLSANDCRTDEDFLECGTCEKTCKNLNPSCTAQCKPPMCKCKEGTVRATDGQCIKADGCPPKLW